MSEETKTEEPTTKLTLFWSCRDVINNIRERVAMIPDIVNRLGYDFKYQMPCIKCDKQELQPPKIEKITYINWRGKERTKIKTTPAEQGLDYHYYFEFSTPLTDEELKFWRIFKIGYIARDFDPNGSWRK